jgi:hypothetical protein
MSRGNSTILGPDGDVLGGPLIGTVGIITADLDIDRIPATLRQFDPVGRYARPDAFNLYVDTRPKPSVTVGGRWKLPTGGQWQLSCGRHAVWPGSRCRGCRRVATCP